jgi:hypothetical protein
MDRSFNSAQLTTTLPLMPTSGNAIQILMEEEGTLEGNVDLARRRSQCFANGCF